MPDITITDKALMEKITVLARQRGMGITALLNELVDREVALHDPDVIDENDAFVQRWLEAGKRSRERSRNAIRSDQIDEFLYDERGLPT